MHLQKDKLVDRVIQRADKLMDAFILGGVGYAGYRIQRNPLDAVYAMLGYKLATNTGGASGILPNVSRVAGLAILANVGVSQVQPEKKEGRIQTSISSCQSLGGTIVQTLPDGISCICDLPEIAPPAPPVDPRICPDGYDWYEPEQRCIKSSVWG